MKVKDGNHFNLMIKKEDSLHFKYIAFQFTNDTLILKLIETA